VRISGPAATSGETTRDMTTAMPQSSASLFMIDNLECWSMERRKRAVSVALPRQSIHRRHRCGVRAEPGWLGQGHDRRILAFHEYSTLHCIRHRPGGSRTARDQADLS
jgi:hypothetical protein